MKKLSKLVSKVAVMQSKATRKLLKKSASDHAREAARFREDSLREGARLTEAGVQIYKDSHPIYEELILPLLNQAVQIANKYGFNVLYQTQTPTPEMPEYTHAFASANSKTITPTMQGCIDLIHSRPTVKRNSDGTLIHTTPEKPFANETARELMAQMLYEQRVKEKGYVRWVPRGNSTMQDQARDTVRRMFAQATPAPVSDTASSAPVSVGAHAEHAKDCDVHQGKRCDC